MTDAIGKLAKGRLKLSESDFKVVHGAFIEHQEAGDFFHWPHIGMDESTVEDGVKNYDQ